MITKIILLKHFFYYISDIKKIHNSDDHLYIYIQMTDQNIDSQRSILTEKQTHQDHKYYTQQNKEENLFDGLNNIKIFAYGIGHFLNDLMAACWFNYLFYYLKRIVKTTSAPSALFAGQIADGIATPLVGYLSDRTKTKFGQRTPWYIGGLIIVICCYIPIYQTFTSENKTIEYIYYSFFMIFINVGWAAVQISHMSLVPSLTCSRKRRDRLNNLRNSFTFISNFLVLALGVVIFKVMSNPPLQYALISYIIVFIGIISSSFFLYHIREVKLTKICQEKAEKLKEQLNLNKTPQQKDEQMIEDAKMQSIKVWFKMPKFYLFGICYMGVRLYTNMFGTYLPFYLTGVLKLGLEEKSSVVPFTVALVPLIVYLFSVLSSFRLNWFYIKFGRKTALGVGTVICVIALGSMLFLDEQNGWIMYIIAAFVGISQTMVLSTGINLISDVVGTKVKGGAFVFGIYSLLDKISSGLAIYFVGSSQAYSKQDFHNLNQYEINFIRYTTVLIPSLACVLASLIVISYPINEYTNKKQKEGTDEKKIQDQLVI